MTKQNPIGVISDEVSQDLDTVIQFAKDFSLDGVEIRSIGGKAFKDLTTADAREIGAKLRDAGLTIAGAATPVFKCELEDKAAIAEHIDMFKRSLDHARLWDCKIARVFTFLRKDPVTKSEHLERAAEHFHSLLDAANGSGVTIGVENETSTLVCTGPEMASIFGLLPDPRIGGVWDPCNILFLAGHEGDPVEEFDRVAKRVSHVHIKDARRENGKPAAHCVEVGTGDVNFESQFRKLRQIDYRGWITLETHWRIQALGEDQTHLPAGYAFSANAEEPSRICMKRMKSFLSA